MGAATQEAFVATKAAVVAAAVVELEISSLGYLAATMLDAELAALARAVVL